MTLSDLYPRGSKLVDVPPAFQGMPGQEYFAIQRRLLWEDAEEFRQKLKAEGFKPPILESKILTPRDLYGMKGLVVAPGCVG